MDEEKLSTQQKRDVNVVVRTILFSLDLRKVGNLNQKQIESHRAALRTVSA